MSHMLFCIVVCCLVGAAGAKDSTVTEQNIHDCIATELVSDVAARICSEVGLDAHTRMSVGRKICTRITRCLLLHNFVEDIPKGIVFPASCGLTSEATAEAEKLCANSIVNASLVSQDIYVQCLGKAETQCGKVSMTALFKQGDTLSHKLDRTEASLLNVSVLLTGVDMRLESFSVATQASLDKHQATLELHGLDIRGLHGTIQQQIATIHALRESNDAFSRRMFTLAGELGGVRGELATLRENWNLRGILSDTVTTVSVASAVVLISAITACAVRRPASTTGASTTTSVFTMDDMDVACERLFSHPDTRSGRYLRSGHWYAAPPAYG